MIFVLKLKTRMLIAIATVALVSGKAHAFTFTPGDIVVDTVSGTTLDSASPITLQQFSLGANATSITAAGTLVLPQANQGANSAISGEYGSASEGILQQSANGQFLTVVGYGVNAATFNSASPSTYGATALGQTTSLTAANQTGTPVTTVPRVVALIGANGSIDTSTALTGVFNQNNPRSAATVDGSSFYDRVKGRQKPTLLHRAFFWRQRERRRLRPSIPAPIRASLRSSIPVPATRCMFPAISIRPTEQLRTSRMSAA